MAKVQDGFGKPRKTRFRWQEGADAPPGDCNEIAGASAEKGPPGFTRSCLRWWSADHSSHLPFLREQKTDSPMRTKDVSTSATKEGDTAPCAVARLAHPGCWVSPRLVHVGVMPTILPFSQKQKNSHRRLEPQKARTNARNGATAVFSATFV